MKAIWITAGILVLIYFAGPPIFRAMANKDYNNVQSSMSTAHERYYRFKD